MNRNFLNHPASEYPYDLTQRCEMLRLMHNSMRQAAEDFYNMGAFFALLKGLTDEEYAGSIGPIFDELGDFLGDSQDGYLGDGTENDPFDPSFDDTADDQDGGSFGELHDALYDALHDELLDGVGDALYDELHDDLLDKLHEELYCDLYDDLYDDVREALLHDLHDDLYNGLYDNLYEDLRDEFEE